MQRYCFFVVEVFLGMILNILFIHRYIQNRSIFFFLKKGKLSSKEHDSFGFYIRFWIQSVTVILTIMEELQDLVTSFFGGKITHEKLAL